jgi:cobyrinic acid a,c-diamide synthase
MEAIVALARTVPLLSVLPPVERGIGEGTRCRIGLAFDEAFHFYYEDNLRRLEQLGAELVRFSPLRDARLPDVDGLYFGGGYPELHAEALSQNRAMRQDVAAFGKRPVGPFTGSVAASCTCPAVSERSMAGCMQWWGWSLAKRRCEIASRRSDTSRWKRRM